MRSYAGRSLFNGFLSAPAARKRQGVIDILNSFPESQFILVGDSGEQDMELYATVAVERPQQILAVFIRDARNSSNGEQLQPVEDPIGAAAHIRWKNYAQRPDPGGSSRSFRRDSRSASNDVASAQPTMTPGPTPNYQSRQRSINRRQTSVDYFSRSGGSSSAPTTPNDNGSTLWLGNTLIQDEPMTGETDTSVGLGPKPTKMPDAEWRRLELQLRVDRARVNMPQSVRFRLFVHPEECAEAVEVLDRLNKKDNKLDLNTKSGGGGTNTSS